MSTQENTTMTLYRNISGRRIPYIFELDADMNIVSEGPDYETIRAEARINVQAQSNALVHAAVKDVNLERGHLATMTAVIDRAIAAGHTVVTSAPEILDARPELSTPENEKTGIISEEPLPGGGKRIHYKPNALDIRVGAWVTSLVRENPIEGTDELRAEFFAAEEALKAKHAADGTTCKPCELGALMRKYREKLEKQGYLK